MLAFSHVPSQFVYLTAGVLIQNVPRNPHIHLGTAYSTCFFSYLSLSYRCGTFLVPTALRVGTF